MARARFLQLLLVTLTLLSTAALPVSAWWSKGHMSVALIAKRHMGASLVEKAELAAKVLSFSGPYPKSPDMVQTAPWADDIKTIGLKTLSTWHYITTPYYTDEDFTLDVSPVQTVNVASVIPMLQTAIEKPAANSDVIVQSLALLLHFMGDIHQPLHNVNLFSNQYPESDLGGNKQLVVIDSKGTKMLLHAYWDSMAEGKSGEDVPRPLSEADYDDLNNFADYLEATYASTLTDKEKNLVDTTEISKETFDLALKYAYPGADNGATLSDEYKTNAKKISERQVLLAGYRLAKMLNTTLKSVSMDTILQGLKSIQSEVDTENKAEVHNHYDQKGISAAVTAIVAVALFIAGIIIATLVVLALKCYLPKRDRFGSYEHVAL
ncbi:3'-nucleotidase/nuclease precursor, putative [Leishmania donovani]|uniref:3'-nucleotidase/nuclease, putative n=1 Tax=Leishmania donovani TaxID=5661 RepID=A0A3Q8IFH4_LEIDO|nr:3'-nucleotidase/nuclease precursor, putative [Leishmania donovani]